MMILTIRKSCRLDILHDELLCCAKNSFGYIFLQTENTPSHMTVQTVHSLVSSHYIEGN